ncbi:MAG: hypothetical protein H7259_00720 [Cytophagales bacterium]|nr:hypothetical protein [Cytophaga sp.]
MVVDYGIIFSYIGILFVLYFSRYFILKRGYTISDKNAWINLSVHLLTLAVLIACVILSFYDLVFRGYNSTSIIYILMVGTGIPFYLFRSKTFLPGFLNVLLSIFCAITVPLFVWCTFVIITDDKEDVFYEDDTYRLENTYNGPLGAKTFPDLFVKNKITEKKYTIEHHPIDKKQITSINIHKLDSTTVLIRVDLRDTLFVSPLLIQVPIEK